MMLAGEKLAEQALHITKNQLERLVHIKKTYSEVDSEIDEDIHKAKNRLSSVSHVLGLRQCSN
ncbi:MAG: hypothetical protein DRQ89_12415 [Epsilonproteobacteria bacterium]|nr:MAG: hypothetical protein DRQ89_12415 [Campylobacterota bacterium]